ncbi:MAG TPA: dienelactone hydrolase family protein [Candidatus Acidoferrales bacterium]|nr:dienelactone hydrolase family protein [Candidatus Acidoferrales bacterium]
MKFALKVISLTLLIVLLGTFGVGADAPKGEMVQFPAGKETIAGFVAAPAKAGRYPAVIVVHEWWGLTDWIKEITTKLADQGYVALAVDLYRGKVATDPMQAHELSRGLPEDRALEDLNAGITYLLTRPDVERTSIGVVGWCMGGGLAVRLAMHDQFLRACVVNYGALPTDPNDLQALLTPVLGNFGAEDGGITPADVHAFEKTVKGLSNALHPRIIDVKEYPDAGHAFMNPTNATGYRPQDAADAWTRTVNFLNRWLK